MNAYIAFVIKEWLEALRTYKIFLFGIIFTLLGIMNPITAKVTPQLLETFMPEGTQIQLPDPTALDSWAQFYKNVGQMGLIVLIILISTMISHEITKGTLINVLTKGLKRSTVIYSKLTMATLLWTMSFILSFALTDIYTRLLWEVNNVHHAIFAGMCLWLFGLFLISLTFLGGVLFNNSYGSLLVTLIGFVFLMLLGIIEPIAKFLPVRLATQNLSIVQGAVSPDSLTPAVWVTLIGILILNGMTIILFNKKSI